ncbi:hypothetical protein HS088_TW06G00342 [Tripterygium wilfordii]|uniref:Uncharacterized protein n=1 Tax=Tripterygium wilfordii TaxID=458696 RepID=A0A7J7DII3_TRIWF|nr:hypothetical protein HS088_TW06G00342 [Tripterygium wilfordii]
MKLSEAMKVRGCRGVKEGSRVRSLQISVRSGIGARIIRPVKEGKGFWLCNFRRRFGRERRKLDKFVLSWEGDFYNGLVLDKYAKGKHVADSIRAVGESLLSSHFGAEIMDQVFDRFSIKAADCMEMGKGAHMTLVVSLSFEG